MTHWTLVLPCCRHEEQESAVASTKKDFTLSLEKAREAGKKERALVKHREANSLTDGISVELTYCVCFALAQAYHRYVHAVEG